MRRLDVVLVLACVLAWGLAFPATKVLLEYCPPASLTAARFALTAMVAPFLPRPRVGCGRFVAFALLFGVGQYQLSTFAMALGLSAGLAAVLMQVQVFTTLALARVFLGERMRRPQVLGVVLGFLGLAIFVALNTTLSVSRLGLFASVLASTCWAGVNLLVKTSPGVSMTSLVAWTSWLNAPLLAASAWWLGDFEEPWPSQPLSGVAPWVGVGILFYLGLVVTFGASVLWNRLVRRYAAVQVVPYAILTPVVGLISSWVIFDDIRGRQLLPAGLVFFGLALVVVPLYGLRPSREHLRGPVASSPGPPQRPRRGA